MSKIDKDRGWRLKQQTNGNAITVDGQRPTSMARVQCVQFVKISKLSLQRERKGHCRNKFPTGRSEISDRTWSCQVFLWLSFHQMRCSSIPSAVQLVSMVFIKPDPCAILRPNLKTSFVLSTPSYLQYALRQDVRISVKRE